MASAIADRLFEQVAPEVEHSASKITVVGVGQVGMASAYAMMIQHTVSELVLIDVVADKLRGEMMDLQHGECFLHGSTIKASTDYAASAGSKICIVTAGARQREGESRLDLVQRNVDIFKTIIPNLVKYSPDTILLIVSNPVDIMTYVSWKLSGLPQHRVIGSGTMLDSSRFRFLMSERLGIAARSCHAWVIGEHGDSSVAVWSGVNIAGVRLQDLSPLVGTSEDPENWEQIHQDVIKSAYEIIKLKGYTSWAIGLMVSQIVSNLLRNTKGVFALSTMVKGFHGVSQEVFLSVPCVIGENGISRVLCQTLNESEKSKLQHSASTLWEVQSSLKF